VGYLTNNSSVHIDKLTAKLKGLGFPVTDGSVSSSALGAAKYIPKGSKCYVIGSDDLKQTLVEAGNELVETGATHVVGGICRDLTYAHLDTALQNLLGGARLIATNTDATYPIEGGRQQPGAGSIVGALTILAGREPDFVVGKPNPFLIDLFIQDWELDYEEVLVVGDRWETDILAGLNACCPTHMVLTGVTTKAPDDVSWSEDLRGLL